MERGRGSGDGVRDTEVEGVGEESCRACGNRLPMSSSVAFSALGLSLACHCKSLELTICYTSNCHCTFVSSVPERFRL